MMLRGRRNERRQGGFTFAELLIVIAIAAIVAGFGFVAIIQHQRVLKLTEMDNIAREIYVAAQNHLTESASTGEWNKLYNENKDNTSYLGENFDPSQDKTFTVSNPANHDFRTFTFSPSGAASLLDINSDGTAATALGLMLPVGATDDSVRSDGYYVVEYDALTASVYGVFYTDNNLGVDDGDVLNIDQSEGGRSDSDYRLNYTKNSRRDIIGYYGGTVTTKPEAKKDEPKPEEEVRPRPITAEIINDARLLLVVTDPNNTLTKSISVQIFDENNSKVSISEYDSRISITEGGVQVTKYIYILDSVVDPDKHFAKQFSSLQAGGNIYAIVKATVQSSKAGSAATGETTCQSNSANSLYGDGSDNSAALIANGRHLENLSKDISGVSEDTVTTAEVTKSFGWAGGGENGTNASGTFIAAIESENKEYGLTSSDQVCFADGSTKGNANTYYGVQSSVLSAFYGKSADITLSHFIIAARPASAYSGLIESTDHSLNIYNLKLSDFLVTGGNGSSGTAGAVIGNVSSHNNAGKSDSSEKSLNISNVSVEKSSSKAGYSAGLFVGSADTDRVNLSECGITGDSSVYASNAGGFIGTLEVSNAALVNCQAGESGSRLSVGNNTPSSESGYAGGLIGYAGKGNISITGCTILASALNVGYADNAQTISAVVSGGFIGSAKTKAKKESAEAERALSLNVSDSAIQSANVSVAAKRHAGGILGQYNLNKKDISSDTISITNTNLTASGVLSVNVSGTGQEYYCAGGFIGEIKDSVSGTVSDCRVEAATIKISENCDNSPASAGGFIGEIYLSNDLQNTPSLTLKNNSIYSSSKMNIEADGAGETYGGGFAGRVLINYDKNTSSTKVAFQTCRILPKASGSGSEKNGTINVAGVTASGGFIGSGSSSEKNSQSVLELSGCGVDGGRNGLVSTANGSAGGFFGELYDLKAALSDDYASFLVKEQAPVNDSKNNIGAGGFGGYARAVTIKYAYAGGRTNNDAQDQGKDYQGEAYDRNVYAIRGKNNVGGFIGNCISSSIDECYTTCSVREDLDSANNDKGTGQGNSTFVGGFVGNCEKSTITNCYCTGLVTAEGCVAGAFSGDPGNSEFQNNFYLGGLFGNIQTADGKNKTGDGNKDKTNSATEANIGSAPFTGGTAKAEPYANPLISTKVYPFEFTSQTLTTHIGDWPASGQPKEQSFEGDFGILYYEIVQHGDNKNARDYYYHGFVGDLTKDGSRSNYEEINTLNTNAQACAGRPYNDHALLTGHNEYVVEEGYLILTSNKYQESIDKFNQENAGKQNVENNEGITVEIGNNDGNNSGLKIDNKINSKKMAKYDEFISKANIVGYKAYAINCGSYASEAGKSTSLIIRDQKFNGGNNSSIVGYSQFYFQPVFSDTLSFDSTSGFSTYYIRSAKQLKLMFESGGNTSTDAIQNNKAHLEQTLDISYDSDKVQFSEISFDGTGSRTLDASNEAYQSPSCSLLFNTTYHSSTPTDMTSIHSDVPPSSMVDGNVHYKLDGLNRYFISILGNTGVIDSVYVTDIKSDREVPEFIEKIYSKGQLKNSSFVNCNFTSGVVANNYGIIDNNSLQNCSGSTFVSKNEENSARINNCVLNNCSFSQAAILQNSNNAKIEQIHAYTFTAPCFVGENTGNNPSVENVIIENAYFNNSSYAGLVNTNDNGASIRNCSIRYADFEGYGIANENRGTIDSCQISDAMIEVANGVGGGFVYSNSGTISNSQIYSQGLAKYQAYVSTYSTGAKYVPKKFSVSGIAVLKADDPQDAYDLVSVGINNNATGESGYFAMANSKIAGFVFQNRGNIANCSFTGLVCGSDASGFADDNESDKNPGIQCCYANARVYGKNTSSGFMRYNRGYANQNHALGVISVDQGAASGFVNTCDGGNTTNCYSAVWQVTGNSSQYNYFAVKENTHNGNFENNYAISDVSGVDNQTGSLIKYPDSLNVIKDTELRDFSRNTNMLKLGGAATTDQTQAYSTSLVGSAYPYPMPVYTDNKKTLTAYGDWRTEAKFYLSQSSIGLYVGQSVSLNNIMAYYQGQMIDSSAVQWTLTGASDSITLKDDENGTATITADKAGTGTILASFVHVDGEGNSIYEQASLSINVLNKSINILGASDSNFVDISGRTLNKTVGDTITLSAQLMPEDSGQIITWESSDPAIAAITTDNNTTKLTCKAQGGPVTVTASTYSGSYTTVSFTLYVSQREVLTNGIIMNGLTVHDLSEYSSLVGGKSIESGTIIKDANGNYGLLFGYNNWYQLSNVTTIDKIVQSSNGNAEFLAAANIIEIGANNNISHANKGDVVHYTGNGKDEYFVARQDIGYNTTINDQAFSEIGIQ